MNITLKKIDFSELPSSLIFLIGDESGAKTLPLKRDEKNYLAQCRKDNIDSLVVFNRLPYKIYVQNFDSEKPSVEVLEILRRAAAKMQLTLSNEKVEHVALSGADIIPEELVAYLEGLHMANYRFEKYKNKKTTLLKEVVVDKLILEADELKENLQLWRRIDRCRDWVNEPVMYLNADTFAQQLAAEAKKIEKVSCTILGQKQIEALKMGGLLAVNRGSEDEARFVILEYKPDSFVNQRSIALVGKGIMYDTGGLNIKPEDYMQEMKSDMAGAATMASALFTAAENKLPVHLMAFLPLTDNRPGKNAYAADDILKMYDGTTVEVVNTDAEGRLVLADAIAYADRQDPELIIDAATLTGAAVRAIGTFAIAAMQQDADKYFNLLTIVSSQVCERIAPLPFWKEYDELIRSDVADLRNCGSKPQAGAITAGRFLAHFAHHPYIHLDIAGVAFYSQRESFYGVGASGFGIRLLYAFFQTYEATTRS